MIRSFLRRLWGKRPVVPADSIAVALEFGGRFICLRCGGRGHDPAKILHRKDCPAREGK